MRSSLHFYFHLYRKGSHNTQVSGAKRNTYGEDCCRAFIVERKTKSTQMHTQRMAEKKFPIESHVYVCAQLRFNL